MRRAFAEENNNVQKALVITNSDPTLHRHAAAALQVRINESDVELASLLKRKAQVEERMRAAKGR
jgi:hypothetical protein